MKKNIAVVFGGYSGEFEISVQSGEVIAKYLDKDKYNVFPVLISKEKWCFIDRQKNEHLIDKNDFSVKIEGDTIKFDKIFIAIHGTPGEDGKLQGYFDMINIPYTSCDQVTSSLTFNKYLALGFIKSLSVVKTAKSVFITKENQNIEPLHQLQFPVFVKPNNGGSSVGMSKVNAFGLLQAALKIAFKEGDEILVEEFINGREITCGVFQNDEEIVCLPIAEIISKNEYFDFEAKYNPSLAEEIVPAQIPHSIEEKTYHISKQLYKKLNCKGVVRFDYIFNDNGIYFLEVNTIPGMTEASIIPKMIKTSGKTLESFFNELIK